MKMFLLNYQDKRSVISYDLENSLCYKLEEINLKSRGYFDVWDSKAFGIIYYADEVFVFIEFEKIPLSSILKIDNKADTQEASLVIKTFDNEYNINTKIDLTNEVIFDSDCANDGSEYNLGLYIEKLLEKQDTLEMFKENVTNRGLLIWI